MPRYVPPTRPVTVEPPALSGPGTIPSWQLVTLLQDQERRQLRRKRRHGPEGAWATEWWLYVLSLALVAYCGWIWASTVGGPP